MSSNENERLLAVQSKVKEVEDTTRQNIAKVATRGDNLDDLERRANSLRSTAVKFSYTSTRVKRQLFWKNIKLWLILLFILLVIVAVLIVALVAATKKK